MCGIFENILSEVKTMNFSDYVKKYEQEAISSLQKLLQIDSVLDESTVSVGAPFGEGIKNALEAFLEMAKKDGFKTFND